MFRWLLNLFRRPQAFGANRSPRWPAVRKAHLEKHPFCEACGGVNDCEVHHIVPFHVDPEKELLASNLLTLCGKGPGGVSCHYLIGHGAAGWQSWNPTAVTDAAYFRRMLLAIRRK